MNPGTIALIVVAVSIALWGLFMANVTIRRQRKAKAAVAEAHAREHPVARGASGEPIDATEKGTVTVTKVPERQRKPLTPDQLAVSRRQFLNRATTASFSAFLGFFGMASLSFLWPKLTGGFGTKIPVGDYNEILKQVGPPNFQPLFVAEGRFWLTYYEGTADAPVYLAVGAKEAKLQALYRKCVHLGCSVPYCSKSMLFECPCHGSKYRLHGEYFAGPAPRGLDRFPVTIEDDKVMVDTGAVQEGPPRGADTWSKFAEPQGPFCVPV
ncbi:MAG: ubiquinol-cytochrome c reductase iron-sulfur subunit [Actinomycetota bacterium]|nr:ubiquinol-cytochrome c reductase iron-sulfur subunit [Actinomycetota bacterium]